MIGIWVRLAMVIATVFALAACTSLSLGTVSRMQTLDVLRDDIAQMTFVVDAPISLLPRDDGVVFEINATTARFGDRNIRAVLVRGDDLQAVSTLAQPANNHIYHLFAFSNEDQEKIREFQKWASDLKAIHGNLGGELSIDVRASFCRAANRPQDPTFSVLIALPGEGKFSPLLSNARLADMGGGDLDDLPICVQT